jgi:hypothetical protein
MLSGTLAIVLAAMGLVTAAALATGSRRQRACVDCGRGTWVFSTVC